MYIGLIIGLIIGLVAAGIVYMTMDYNDCESFTMWIVTVPIIVICIAGTGWIGYTLDNADLRSFIAKFNATKETYNMSINDERLSGLERLEIVKMVNESNRDLASRKANINEWWNNFVSDDLKDELNQLESIK
jgi:hypothetical protein